MYPVPPLQISMIIFAILVQDLSLTSPPSAIATAMVCAAGGAVIAEPPSGFTFRKEIGVLEMVTGSEIGKREQAGCYESPPLLARCRGE